MTNMEHIELRETEAAQAWIEQFDAADRPIASLLLESLAFVESTELHRGIRDVVKRNLAEQGRPVALYAVREAPILPRCVHREPSKVRYKKPYFDPDDDTVRPDAVASGAGVGSEGDLAHLIRDLHREFAANRALDHPSVHSMRSTKSPRIILVDDIIGSGKRTTEFVDWFCDHKTIRSWLSFHYVQIVVVAYAGVDKQSARLGRHRFVSHAVCDRLIQQGRGLWTDHQRCAIKRLCHKYASATSHPWLPLGFREAFTCLVFEHKCPNTAPAILWAEKKSTWKALFKARPGLDEPSWPIPVNQQRRDSMFLKAIGQNKLSITDWQAQFSGAGRLRMLLLAAVAKKLHRAEVLSEYLEVSVAKTSTLTEECRKLGWIDATPRITKAGLRVLDYARNCGVLKDEAVELKTGYYFPRTLRVTRGSF